MTTENKTGIELLKKLFKVVYGTTIEVKEDYENNQKIDITEIFGLVDNIYDLVALLLRFKEIIAECEDINTGEIKEFYEYVQSFGFMPEDITKIINHLIVIIENAVEIYNIIKGMKKEEI